MELSVRQRLQNRCTFTPWTVRQIVGAYSGDGHPRFVLPAFQRDFVWKLEQQKSFISSVRKNLPVGAILLFVPHDEPGVRYIVDGLQRCTTLVKYSKERFKYLGVEHLTPDIFEPLVRCTVPGYERLHADEQDHVYSSLQRYVLHWLKDRTSFDVGAGYDAFFLYQSIAGKHVGNQKITIGYNQATAQIIGHLLDAVREVLTMDDAQIPVIEFSGSQEHLPTIFERLNTEGTKLNKFDVLAAQWNDASVQFDQNDIALEVKRRYSELQELGLEYVGDGETRKKAGGESNFLIYEFVVGLGRVLKRRFPRLYRPPKKSTEVDSIGFNLAILVAGTRIAELGKLRGWIRARFAGDHPELPDVTALANLMFDASELVGEWLAAALDSDLFKRKWKSPHAEYQIAAIVASVARSLIESDLPFKAKPLSAVNPRFGVSIPQRYWYELLSGSWKGSGDSRAWSRVDERTYEQTVPRDQFRERLKQWHTESLALKQRAVDPLCRGLLALVLDWHGASGRVNDAVTVEPVYDGLANDFVLSNLQVVKSKRDMLVALGAPDPSDFQTADGFIGRRFQWLEGAIIDALYNGVE